MTPPSLSLNDGRTMPQFGFGVWRVPNDEAAAVVGQAFSAGYRSIDTATVYGNEKGVGRAIAESGIARDELFITTKLWNDDQGFAEARDACNASLDRLGLEAVDLYLIHWPMPMRDTYVDSWRALIKLREEGRARSIGVSNFNADHLQRLFEETGIIPAVNQIELHPRFQQKRLRAFHKKNGIATESWSPLGRGNLWNDPTIGRIAEKHGRTHAQIILRWHLDNGLIAIPKSATPSRIVANFAVFDFALDAQDLSAIDALDDPYGRAGPNPATYG